jgi:hypothetical protein
VSNCAGRAFAFLEAIMPIFTIEATYRILVYRQRSYKAKTLVEACRLAIDDEDWEGQKKTMTPSARPT